MLGRARFLIVALLLLLPSRPSEAATAELNQWLDHLERLIPQQAAKFGVDLPADVAKATDAVEQWTVIAASRPNRSPGEDRLVVLSELLTAKDRCDHLLDRAFDQRSQFVTLPDDPARREAIRGYLRFDGETDRPVGSDAIPVERCAPWRRRRTFDPGRTR